MKLTLPVVDKSYSVRGFPFLLGNDALCLLKLVNVGCNRSRSKRVMIYRLIISPRWCFANISVKKCPFL